MKRSFKGACLAAVGFLAPTTFAAPRAAHSADPGCAALSKEIDSFVLASRDRTVLERLAPYMSANVVPGLIARAQTAPPDLAFQILVAAGRSGHAGALPQLKSFKPGNTIELRAARAVALLALGDGAETATISVALESGPRDLRLNVARALARMRHPRPRELLRSALDDPEPEVRLAAAEGLVVVRSMKGRRVLLELSRSGPEPLKARAARVLGSSRWAAAHLDAIDDSWVGRAEARLAARGRKDVTKRARSMIGSQADAERSGAFAVLAVSAEETPASLEKLAKKAVEKVGEEAEAELLMAQALMGQTSAIDRLSSIRAGFCFERGRRFLERGRRCGAGELDQPRRDRTAVECDRAVGDHGCSDRDRRRARDRRRGHDRR